MTVVQKCCPRDFIEGKKSKTLRTHKIQQNMLLGVLVLLAPNSQDHELFPDISFVSVLAMVLLDYWKKLGTSYSKPHLAHLQDQLKTSQPYFSKYSILPNKRVPRLFPAKFVS